MKILVTGTAGFIGFHLTKRLLEMGHEVVGIDNVNDYYDVNLKYGRLRELGIEFSELEDRVTYFGNKELEFIKCDLEDYSFLSELFTRKNFETVVHLAAQAGVRYSIESPFSYVKSNLVGFSNILELCRHHGIGHLVYASSSSVYGDSTDIPFKESHRTDSPVSLYAATKKSNEVLAHAYSQLYGFRTSGLRFFTVYGPWGRPDMAPILFANAISKGETIKVFNKGDMKRDFTFVDDIVEGIVGITAVEKRESLYEVYNIGNSKPVDLMEFIKEMERQLGKKAKLKMMPMQAGDVKLTYADTSKLSDEVDYKPNTPLGDGLRTFVSWHQSYYKF